jgi:hypothetical protein
MKTAYDYMTEYTDLQAKVAAIESRIAHRLADLCKQHPDVPVARKADLGGTIIRARSLGDIRFISDISTADQLKYIHIIEKWLQDQDPVKQTEIDFKDE